MERRGSGAVSLPYRYDVLMRVTVVGDGIHADAVGVMATAKKIAAAVEAAGVPNVVRVSAFPANVTYLGKVDVEAGDPPASESIAAVTDQLGRER